MAETVSQVIGSPDFSIFRLVNDATSRNQVPFKTLSVLIWIVFGVCISVLFITFLVRFVSSHQYCTAHSLLSIYVLAKTTCNTHTIINSICSEFTLYILMHAEFEGTTLMLEHMIYGTYM